MRSSPAPSRSMQTNVTLPARRYAMGEASIRAKLILLGTSLV